ncbi:dimethylmenaquinone methyltransferase [Bordetella ansorpii]|uniref:Putative 4-hydroxy-4-methyl-2-oxoglutarate aldolase n=1 Tax=Bordetella ansorpii TaxID=288768 RepID=A0A157SLM1_9BORD|nr:RraA family protein [Bordetella ansorpii]SAI71380.1 dimethylmenaquinone methyltransferase [Bordetella ansorpii]
MNTPLPGTRILPAAGAGDASVREALSGIATAHLSDNLGRQVGIVGLQPYHRTGKLVGTALTVRTRPGDNLFIYQAMMQVQPGHVLVIDAGGALNNAVLGEIMKRYLQRHGCAGVVVDGAIRDVGAFAQDDFPCYARGVTHRGPFKDGPGEVNVPVTIGGQVIEPGDWVVGDEDGLVSFAPGHARALIEAARAHAAKEVRIMAEIATGQRTQSWMQAAFAAKGMA